MMAGGNQENLQEGGNEARNLSGLLLLAGPTTGFKEWTARRYFFFWNLACAWSLSLPNTWFISAQWKHGKHSNSASSLFLRHHPDRGGDEAKFKDISKAYEANWECTVDALPWSILRSLLMQVLSDPQKRQIYDAYGEEGLVLLVSGGAGSMTNKAMHCSLLELASIKDKPRV